MKNPLTTIASLLCGCGRPQTDDRADILGLLEQLPTGLKVVHSPIEVVGPREGLHTGWEFSWTFKTEVHALERPLKIIQFGIAAWDGSQWIIPPSQKDYNTGVLDTKTFEEWYSHSGAVIKPGSPAIDPQNWAGSHIRKDFKQKWFFIGADAAGKKWKGEGIVTFVVR